jgi:protein phosphatase
LIFMSHSDVPKTFQLDVAARTHTGERRGNNEDRLLVADLDARTAQIGAFCGRLVVGNGGALLAVCDGMGGEAGGEIASHTAVSALYRAAVTHLPGRTAEGVAEGLREAVETASREIRAIAASEAALRRMGTTATVCTVADDTLLVAQVGDSRAYLLRGDHLVQLTRDQTLVSLLVERGELTEDQAKTCELSHVILQALGHPGGIDVDVGRVRLARGDVLLVCSDGLFGCVDDPTIASILRAPLATAECCDALVAQALGAGAPDNVTCIVARCEGAAASSVERPAVEKLATRRSSRART